MSNGLKKILVFITILFFNIFCFDNVKAINMDVKDVTFKDKSTSTRVDKTFFKGNTINSKVTLISYSYYQVQKYGDLIMIH